MQQLKRKKRKQRRLFDLQPLHEWSDQVGQELAVVNCVQVVEVQ